MTENPYKLEQLKNRIDSCGFAHARIANRAGISPGHFSLIYSEKNRPRLDICSRIVNAIYELNQEKENANKKTIGSILQ